MSVHKPTAVELLQFLDASQPLGIAPLEKTPSRTLNKVGKVSRPPLYSYFVEMKKKHPRSVILIRIGDFYETVGIDAVLLVQHAGLNPMGRPSKGNPVRAGFPKGNLRRTVADLVEGAGLSVVVCEEVSTEYSYGFTRSRQKERYIAAVVTPAAPQLLHGLMQEQGDIPLDAAPPLIGIAPRVGGHSLIEISCELRRVIVTEGLTDDAVFSRLHEGGLAPPLFLHTHYGTGMLDADPRLKEAAPEKEWEARVMEIFRNQVGAVVRYDDPDPVQGMIRLVKRHLGLPIDTHFLVSSSEATERPRPLYYSTATNVGLHKTRGVPSLLDAVLPAGVPLPSRRWLKDVLLRPPSPDIRQAIYAACESLSSLPRSIPHFPVVAPVNIALKLRSQQANDSFYRELSALCGAVSSACGDSELNGFTEPVLQVSSSQNGVSLEREAVARACGEVQSLIHAVVHHDDEYGSYLMDPSLSSSSPSEEEEEAEEESIHTPASSAVTKYLFTNEEPFRKKVREEQLRDQLEEVAEAAQRIKRELMHALDALLTSHHDQRSNGTSGVARVQQRPSIVHDMNNNALWLKVPNKKLLNDAFIHPADRNGRAESAYYSTPALENALNDYRRACDMATQKTRQVLARLAIRLENTYQHYMIAAGTFSVVASALEAHVREARRKLWSLPPPPSAGGGEQTTSLTIDGMWPYWMDARDPKLVKNSINAMQGMYLLTGPNMAGKSTVLRSVAATCILASCGLCVPARSACVPFIDAFMLRTFSADSPLEGRSAFAVEMNEMRHVFEDVTANSLVLLDELGKGTEVKAGAALAGAMLEQLDKAGCKGIFATHLHVMLDMPLQLSENVQRMKMEIKNVINRGGDPGGGTAMAPTWRMVPGTSTESLALDVARDCRLPEAVLERADCLYKDSSSSSTRKASASRSSSSSSRSGSSSSQQESACTKAVQMRIQSLEDAGNVLRTTAATTLDALCLFTHIPHGDDAHITTSTTRSIQMENERESFVVHYVRGGEVPPPRSQGGPCVYVVQRKDGYFYCGSTHDIYDRLAAHRTAHGASPVSDPRAAAAYIQLSPEAGAAAAAIEADVIRALKAAGAPLLSETDARRRDAPLLTRRHRVGKL